MARGVGWRLVIRDPNGIGDAHGRVTISTPTDPEAQPRFDAERMSLRSGDLWPSAEGTERVLADASRDDDHVRNDDGTINLAVSVHPGACQVTEIVDYGAQPCRRFSTGPANIGDGPLDLVVTEAGSVEGQMHQRIHHDDGTTETVPGGSFDYHPEHLHYHDGALQPLELFRVAHDRRGRMEGNFVDFGDNPDGLYVIRAHSDPDGDIRETREDDNTSYTSFRVRGDHISVLERGVGDDPWDRRRTVVDDTRRPTRWSEEAS